MYMWGVTLMIIGGLSFVLPLFGRQFVLISALGLTGAGSAAIGIVLFAIGLLLFFGAKVPVASAPPSRPRSEPHSPSAARPTPTPTPTSSTLAAPTVTAPAASPPGEGRFALDNSDYTDPYGFGLGLVGGSLESSRRILVGMIGSAEMPSQRVIKTHEAVVQLHALALITAIYYFCANKASSSDKQALTRLAMGLVDGFAAIFDPGSGSEAARRKGLSIYNILQDYCESLANEFASLDPNTVGENPLDMGPTARLLVHNIAGQCGMQEALAESHLERLMLEKIARDCGILALLNVLADKRVRYLP